MRLEEQATFEQVRQIVADFSGVDPARITPETDLSADLGIAGDDGLEIFEALDLAFEVDWSGLHPAIHFGEEGLCLPPP